MDEYTCIFASRDVAWAPSACMPSRGNGMGGCCDVSGRCTSAWCWRDGGVDGVAATTAVGIVWVVAVIDVSVGSSDAALVAWYIFLSPKRNRSSDCSLLEFSLLKLDLCYECQIDVSLGLCLTHNSPRIMTCSNVSTLTQRTAYRLLAMRFSNSYTKSSCRSLMMSITSSSSTQ